MIEQKEKHKFDYYSGAHNPETVGFFSSQKIFLIRL